MTDLTYETIDQQTGEIYTQLNEQQDDLDTIWHSLIDEGQEIVQTGDNMKWQLGRLACKVANRWQRSKKTLIKFAGEINMAHPRLIYEYHEVAEYFPESAYCELIAVCPMLSWSHFRAAYRHAKRKGEPLAASIARLRSASDNTWSVEAFTEKLSKDPDGDWFTSRKRTPCEIITSQTFEDCPYMDIVIRVPKMDGQDILSRQTNRNHVTYINEKWEEQRVDKK